MTALVHAENPRSIQYCRASAARTCQETLRAQKTAMRPSLRWSQRSLRDRGTRRMTCSMCRRSFRPRGLAVCVWTGAPWWVWT